MALRFRRSYYAPVLLGSIAVLTFLYWRLMIFLPQIWGWPVTDIRSTFRGQVHQSAFVMLSAISGLLGGLGFTEKLKRGWNETGLTLVGAPIGAALLSELETRVLQLLGVELSSSTAIHTTVIFLWFVNLFVFHRLSIMPARRP